jgi:L-threonylcarbamoyladenylate synthase
MIKEAVGDCEIAFHKDGDKVKSPGVKYTHYKPKCDTALFNDGDIDGVKQLYAQAQSQNKTPYVMCSNKVAKDFDGYNLLKLGNTSEEIASNLYDKLLEGEKKADLIIAVAMPDETGVNMGIMNRMKKSCG